MAPRKKPGKYASIVTQLPKYPGVEPDRRDIIEGVKTRILDATTTIEDPPIAELLKDMDTTFTDITDTVIHAVAGKPWASEFARMYAELRGIKDKLAEWDSSANVLLEAYQMLMVNQFEVEGISSVRLENGVSISTHQEPFAQVVDKEAFRLWCIKNGLESAMSLSWQTTNSLTKELLLGGNAEPDGVTTFAKTMVRLGSK